MNPSEKTYLTFEAFWKAIAQSIKSKNYPTYHPCCKVWVARTQPFLRKSHCAMMTWGEVVPKKMTAIGEPEEVLQAHMVEHEWGPPIYFNARCEVALAKLRRTQALRVVGRQPPEHFFSGAFHMHQPVTMHSSPGRPHEEHTDLHPPVRPSSDADPRKLEAVLDSQSQLCSAQ